MARINIPHRGWVLVCDGAKALILQNEGTLELVNLKLVDVLEHDGAAAHELGSDRPGRVHESLGQSRSAVEMTDLHERAEAEFLKRVADELTGILQERQARSLVLVAPPKALGLLRQAFPASVRTIAKQELAKDLTGLPISQIERHLAGG
ncbi:MAG TPA: host attachment protein [Kaistia sp.]|nr:host attachment protein [Kaistia sp.]